jgi:GH24 family phage-related lysozyme (muramidase)
MFTMMEELKYRIKEHEGFRDTVYQDHLGNATVGWGHLVTSDDNFQVGITYPEEVLEAVFEKDFKRAREGADQHQLLKQEQRSSKTGKKANA